MRRVLSCLALATGIAGCTVGPDYEAPAIDVPPAWSGNSSQSSAVTEQWWQGFADETLVQLVSGASAQNLDVAQAVDRLTEARAQLRVTRSGAFPSVSAQASGTVSRGLNYSGAGQASNSTTVATSSGETVTTSVVGNESFDVSWEIDLWGKVRRSTEASAADRDAAIADIASARLAVIGDIAKAYIDLRTAQTRTAVAESAVARYRDTLHLTRLRSDAGLGARSDVAKAEGALAAAEATLPPLRSSAEEARHKIALLMGKAPRDLDGLLSAARPMPRFSGLIDAGIPADLLRRRPDLVKSERKLAAATATIGVKEAARYPALSITGSLGASQSNIGGISLGIPGTWSIGPSLSLPIFNAGKLQAEVEVAVAQTDQARTAYRSAILTALQDVENALSSYRADEEKVVRLRRAERNYGDAVRLSKDLYAKGLSTYLDVLDAERSLFSTEDERASAEGQRLKDIIVLFKSLGGGW
ncbi:efflux transporter outer membrane subunit [Reyranella sp.]|uniref:efflux transporter outer membrane subunit n=1 Tax=Reyranella sp. TaxID=1929291 RepID=UPI003BAC8298